MEFEWDETKRLANLDKHGIDFLDVKEVFDGDTVTVEDDRYRYGEQRFVTFGLLQGRVVAVVYPDRGEAMLSDCPEITPEQFAQAVVRRGGLPSAKNKDQVTLRIDSDVLEWFKQQGRGYQTQINSLLRAYMEAHR